MSETTEDFVLVLPKDAPEGQKPGKVPAKALDHWLGKGFVQVTRDGKPVELADRDTVEATVGDGDVHVTEVTDPAADGAQEPVTAPESGQDASSDTQTPEGTPAAPEDGTAADSADDTSTDSEPTTTGRAGKAR